jgi:hypothetical protein
VPRLKANIHKIIADRAYFITHKKSQYANIQIKINTKPIKGQARPSSIFYNAQTDQADANEYKSIALNIEVYTLSKNQSLLDPAPMQ